MTYSYQILPTGLHTTADAAIAWFTRKWGLKKSLIEVEESFDDRVRLRPTFVARTSDFHMLCIEVSESIYSNTLDSAALDCWGAGLPVKLVVAVPKDGPDQQYGAKLKLAKRAGVGVLEVDHSSGILLHQPLSLSLAGVREIDLSAFPRRYRQALDHARETFRDGEPSKACSLVYDELEDASRRFAVKCVSKGLWKNMNGRNLQTGPWATILSELNSTLDRSVPATKPVTPVVMSRLVGVTAHRNDSGHKPKSVKQRMARDLELRTRFEGSVDLFRDFLIACKAFRI